jgi:hypothetical protein
MRPITDKEDPCQYVGDENGCARSVRTLEEDTRSVERRTVSHSRSSRRHKNISGYITHGPGVDLYSSDIYKASCPGPCETNKGGRVRNIQGGMLEERRHDVREYGHRQAGVTMGGKEKKLDGKTSDCRRMVGAKTERHYLGARERRGGGEPSTRSVTSRSEKWPR